MIYFCPFYKLSCIITNNNDEGDTCHQSKAIAEEMNSANQPRDGSFEMKEGTPIKEVWGQLYPHSGTFPRMALEQEMFRLGGAKTSNCVIRELNMV